MTGWSEPNPTKPVSSIHNSSISVLGVRLDMKESKVRSTLECWQTLKKIGKEVYLNMLESIHGVVINAHKTPPSRLCYVKYTAFYLLSDKQSLSPYTTGKKGEMTSLLSESPTLAVHGYTFLDSETIVSQFYFLHIKRLHVSFENL